MKKRIFTSLLAGYLLLTSQLLMAVTPEEVTAMTASDLQPTGEIARVYSMIESGNKQGDQERETMTPTLLGKVVQWTLPVYKAKKRDDGRYEISTSSAYDKATKKTGYVSTRVMVTPQNANDTAILEGLKKKDMVTIKGIVDHRNSYKLVIEPAILVK